MITKFKLFEAFTIEEMLKLKIGDILVCNIKDANYVAKYGKKYKINAIKDYMVSLKTLNNKILKYSKLSEHSNKIKWFYINNFITELEWEAKKYNL